MWIRILTTIIVPACSVLLLAGCGGTAPQHVTEYGQQEPPAVDLPLLPAGQAETRTAATFDGVTVPGNPAFDSANATPDGASLLLESGEQLFNLTAWAIYQLAESPGDPVDMVTVDAQYLDPDPVVHRPEEGYWTAYADYASDTWVFSGPHKTLQTRVSIPEGATAVSPGGFHYILVLVCQRNLALVHRVQVGGYDGLGYEFYALGRPPGHSAGYWCDLQLDPAGNPQIAYLNRPLLIEDEGAELLVARKAGDEWEVQAVAPGIDARWFSLALGDDGRRALLISERGSTDLWLYYDDNTGEFTDVQLISNSYADFVKGSVTFVNSADDALQPLDMAVVVYAKPALGMDVDTFSRSYDGVTLTADVLVYPVPSYRPARLQVTTTAAKLALVAVPDEIAGDWSGYVGTYSGGLWNFGVVPAWGPLDNFESSEEYTPDVVIRESPTGDLIGCYKRTYGNSVRMGRYDGISWLSGNEDILQANIRDYIDMGAFSSGRSVILMSYSDMKPMLRWGLAGSGENYGHQYINADSYAAISDSMAVDSSDSVHIAAYNAFKGELDYYVRPPSGPVTMEVVDTGGLTTGSSFLFVQPVYVDDHLHLFYNDSAHPALLHAENQNGIWLVENEVIENQGFPFYVLGAGYLEETNLLYVVYLDYLDLQFYLVSGTPGAEDWERQAFGLAYGELAIVGDDETNISLVGAKPSPITDSRINFILGPPRSGQPVQETITLNADLFNFNSAVAFSAADGRWGFVTTADPDEEVLYFQRATPGNWTGPYTVTQLIGPGAQARAAGLSYLDDGTPRVVVLEQASGDPEIKTAVYAASPGGTDFSFLLKIKGVQDAVAEMPYATAISGPGGEPVIGVVNKLLADTTWDIDLFVSDGPGSWTLHETWDSPLGSFYPRLCLAPDGQPAIAAVENDETSGMFGNVVVYYPW